MGGSAAAVALLVHSIDVSQAASVLVHADARLLALGVALTALGLGLGVQAWASAVAATGAQVPVPRLASWYLQGVFVGHLTPSGVGGDATRAVTVSRHIGHGRGVASVAAARMATALSMAIWGLAGTLIAKLDFGVPLVVAAAGYLAAVLAGWALMLGVRRRPRRADDAGHRLLAPARRLAGPILDALTGVRSSHGALTRCIVLALGGWLLNLFALQTFAAAVGVHQPTAVFAVVIPLSLLATAAPVTLNGIGLREGVLVGLLVHLGSVAAHAAALALLIDVQLVPFAIAGAALFVATRRRRAAAMEAAPAV